MSRIFILQKDLPDVKAGAEFRENYGDDTYEYNSENGADCRYRRYYVEHSPEWFKLRSGIQIARWTEDKMYFSTNADACMYDKSQVEFEISKVRLEEILIAESKGKLTIIPT